MAILFPALAIAFAAFCVWLAVRVINRRERWAKWTFATVVVPTILYFGSFGPVCWLCENQYAPDRIAWIFYRPLAWLSAHRPNDIGAPVRRYAAIFSKRNDVGLTSKRGIEWILLDRPFETTDSPIDYEMHVSGIYR
jgi:hypothetical protein